MAAGCSQQDRGGLAGVEQGEAGGETVSDPIVVQAGTVFETNPPPSEAKPEKPGEREEEESPEPGQDRSGEQDPETGDDANPEQFEPETGY